MNRLYLSLLISSISGFATLLGIIPIFLKIPKEKINSFLTFFLALSASIMINISLFDLLPSSVFNILNNNKNMGLVIIIFTLIISYLFIKIVDRKDSNNKLLNFGILSLISLTLHNIPEGIITYISSVNNLKLGIKMAFAIMIHNIPEGLCIAIPIYYATSSRKKAIILTLIASLSETFGAILSFLFLYKYINNYILSIILTFVAFLMINLSINSYNSNIKNTTNKKFIYYGFIIGIIITILSLIL